MTHPIHSADSADTPEFLGRLIAWSMAPPGPEQETEYAGIIDYINALAARRAAAQVGAKGAADILPWQARRADWLKRHKDKREGPPSNDPFTTAEIADLRARLAAGAPASPQHPRLTDEVMSGVAQKLEAAGFPRVSGAPAETPKPATRREVFAICDAYESGMGHGLQRDGHKDGSIWGDPDCGKAYEIGYEQGEERAAPAATIGAGEGKDAQTQAVTDVWAERQRQISAEGWTPEHDDNEHSDTSTLARAAACYATGVVDWWPWDLKWWKPGTERRNLVKAGALILADIERIDRAAMRSKTSPGEAG